MIASSSVPLPVDGLYSNLEEFTGLTSTVITTFQLSKPITREEARSIFLSTAPKYQGVAGLFRKCYVLSQDGNTAGGIYLWNSRAEAEAMYTESWRVFVREKYGADPSVTYFDSPVVVDNLTHEILSDE